MPVGGDGHLTTGFDLIEHGLWRSNGCVALVPAFDVEFGKTFALLRAYGAEEVFRIWKPVG